MTSRRLLALVLCIPFLFTTGCGKKSSDPTASGHDHAHAHTAPHGGTAVVLGDELYHLELVRDAATGTLQAFVFDGELEKFIRTSAPTIEITAEVNGTPRTLVLGAVANAATGETVGDTSLFEGQADWLKTATEFNATLKSITIRGTTFDGVAFNFPHGNEHD